jgi:hypothetical protein
MNPHGGKLAGITAERQGELVAYFTLRSDVRSELREHGRTYNHYDSTHDPGTAAPQSHAKQVAPARGEVRRSGQRRVEGSV